MTIEPSLGPGLKRAIEAGYGIDLRSIEFLPLGADVRSISYHCLTTDGTRLYLKLRRKELEAEPFLSTSVWVMNHVPDAIAPLQPFGSAQGWVEWDSFWIFLFPLVTGTSGWEIVLNDTQLRRIGAGVRALHGLKVPRSLDHLPSESFGNGYRRRARRYLEAAPSEGPGDEAALRFWRTLQKHRPVLVDLIQEAEGLAEGLRKDPPPFVCCHGDLHSGNYLVEASGDVHPLDWDTLSWAPKEKDLMFPGAGIGGMLDRPGAWEAFQQGYGSPLLHPEALQYFRQERIIQDLVAFAEQLWDSAEGGDDRLVALGYWERQFEPGGVIDIALGVRR